MLKENYDFMPTPLDLVIFEKLVPPDHYLRQLKAAISFIPVRALVADCYSSEMGRGAIDPVLLLKLHLLEHHYGLSDAAVINQAQVNVAFRFFLDLSIEAPLLFDVIPQIRFTCCLKSLRMSLAQPRFAEDR
ncbi:MAG TPA: transposase [Blastocatellia bacterium]|nr:transposase [Blastocatellia bacterium]